MSDRTYVATVDDLIALNKKVLDYGGGQHAIQHETSLRHAVARPWIALSGIQMYPTPYDKGAVLMENIIQTKPFRDANKRTAFAAGATLIHLLTSGRVLALNDEVVRVSNAVEYKSIDLTALAEWFEDHTRFP